MEPAAHGARFETSSLAVTGGLLLVQLNDRSDLNAVYSRHPKGGGTDEYSGLNSDLNHWAWAPAAQSKG